MSASKRIAITGATGQIGRVLSRRLIEARHEVVVLSRDPERARSTVPGAAGRVLVERYRLTPAKTAFIDDAEPNVLVAADLGFRPIRFLGAPRLRSDLRGLGLPLAAAAAR